MCGVFYIDDDMLHEIRSIAREIDQKLNTGIYTKDIHPTEYAPVLIEGKRGIRMSKQRWGYPGVQNKGVIFNARSETVTEKRLFQNGIRYHRAVIPARHFYEWNVNREKNIFSRKDSSTMFLAGFYDIMSNEERFVILTTQANESMRSVHDRMPLVLEANQLESWLFEPEQTENILKQAPVLLKRKTEFEQMTLF
ncbi:MAG: SOS response-associated peptidase family protein [Eubacteriales bacterium]|nr:SOS response-associated peptidase family protein [Eubacteriales bacterium]